MRIRACVAALVLVCSAGTAAAQEDGNRALAAEVVRLSGAEDMVRSMFNDLAPILASAIASEADLSAAQVERLTVILVEELAAATPDLVEAASLAYADTLTRPQLLEIRTFLSSPAGRAMVESQSRMEEHIAPAAERIGGEVATRAITRLLSEQTKD